MRSRFLHQFFLHHWARRAQQMDITAPLSLGEDGPGRALRSGLMLNFTLQGLRISGMDVEVEGQCCLLVQNGQSTSVYGPQLPSTSSDGINADSRLKQAQLKLFTDQESLEDRTKQR